MKDFFYRIFPLICVISACKFANAIADPNLEIKDVTFGLKLTLKVQPNVEGHQLELRLENHSNRAINIDRQAIGQAILDTSLFLYQSDNEKRIIDSSSNVGSSHRQSVERIAADSERALTINPNESYAVKFDLDKLCRKQFEQKDAIKMEIKFKCPSVVLGYADDRPSKEMNAIDFISNTVTLELHSLKRSKTH